jgi:hypothetical protein
MAKVIWLTMLRKKDNTSIRAAVYEDIPEFKAGGGLEEGMQDSQAIELLKFLGVDDGLAKKIVADLSPFKPYEHQFDISPEQEKRLRKIFTGEW